METYKPKMTAEEKKEKAVFVANKLNDGGKLLISITHASKSNMSYRYKAVLAYVDEVNGLMFETLSYWMASELNEKAVIEWAGDTLKGHGCGFDRYQDAAYTVGKLLERHGLIVRPLETIANRNTYRII